jgi:hypothetical protein
LSSDLRDKDQGRLKVSQYRPRVEAFENNTDLLVCNLKLDELPRAVSTVGKEGGATRRTRICLLTECASLKVRLRQDRTRHLLRVILQMQDVRE